MQPEGEKKLSRQLKQALKDNEHKFKKVYQLAYYGEQKGISELEVFTKSSYDVECNVVYCLDGNKYKEERKSDILHYVIRTLEEEIPQLKNQFSIAFIHNSLSDYFEFKKMLGYFPEKFIRKMKGIYIVKANFMVRFFHKISLGTFNSFLSSITTYVESIQQIEGINKVTFGGNMSKSQKKLPIGDKENYHPHSKIIQNKLYGRKLNEYDIGSNGIPTIIQILIIRLFSCQRFLQAEGIMRKSCDVEKLQLLEHHLMNDAQPEKYLRTLEDPYLISGCLKKIYANFYIPLFSYELYDMVMSYRSTGKEQDDLEFIRTVLVRMESINLKVLLYLMAFLKKGITLFKEVNKMSSYNLAVVFGPCLFRPKEYSLQALMNSGKFSRIIMLLIDNLETIIGEQKVIEVYNLLDRQVKEEKS